MDSLTAFLQGSKTLLEQQPPFLRAVVEVILVLFFSALVLRFGRVAIKESFERQKNRLKHKEGKIRTLESISLSVLRYAVYFVAIVSILPTFGVEISSILAGAGVIGLALGFGAQNLVRDVIAGFFILFEDQYSVGDYIQTSGISGYVEEIGLRITRLRDFSGVEHVIPNGTIGVVSNHSRNEMRAMIDVGVAYEEDILQVERVLNEICVQVSQELDSITEGPKVLGIQELGSSEVVFRIWARTSPMQQWSVERHLRRKIKMRFDELGIEIPYPRRVVLLNKEEDK